MPLVETLPVHAEYLGSASGRPDTEIPSLSSAVRELPEEFGRLVDRSGDPAQLERRPAADDYTAMEHLASVRDALHCVGDRLEQLVASARLIEGRPVRCERIGACHAWDPEVVLAVFRAEAERVARIARELAGDEALPVACRRGLGLIAAELVDHLVRDGEAHLQQAQLAMTSEPTTARGRQS